jgi:hypothetical protein
MSALVLKVEVDGGTPAMAAAAEMVDLAGRIAVIVEAEVCGVTMRARPYQLARDVLAEWERECRLAQYPQD